VVVEVVNNWVLAAALEVYYILLVIVYHQVHIQFKLVEVVQEQL
jgi:hypothetical protein